jgi:hypothetical protein
MYHNGGDIKWYNMRKGWWRNRIGKGGKERQDEDEIIERKGGVQEEDREAGETGGG